MAGKLIHGKFALSLLAERPKVSYVFTAGRFSFSANIQFQTSWKSGIRESSTLLSSGILTLTSYKTYLIPQKIIEDCVKCDTLHSIECSSRRTRASGVQYVRRSSNTACLLSRRGSCGWSGTNFGKASKSHGKKSVRVI